MHLNEYQSDIEKLTIEIRSLVDNSKREIYKNVNNQILLTYWEIGNRILTKEKEKAFDRQSSRFLITELSKELTRQLGKGYNRSNLTYMRLFSLRFPDGVTLSHQLSWSHFEELLKIDDELERKFYKNQSIREKWSVRELRRQKDSALFQRLALIKDKKGIIELAQNGQIIERHSDIIKDPYILEFLGLPEQERYTEKQLENG